MVFHPSHRPLEIATRFPQFHSPDDDDISPTNKKHKGTLLLGVDIRNPWMNPWAMIVRPLQGPQINTPNQPVRTPSTPGG